MRSNGEAKRTPRSRFDTADGDDVFESAENEDFFLPALQSSEVDGRRQLSSFSSSVFTPSITTGNKVAATWNVHDRKYTDGGIPSTVSVTLSYLG